MNPSDRIRGVILGGALGDAYGSIYEGEGRLRGVSLETIRNPSLSDDSQLTLATCEALIDKTGTLGERIGASFSRWYSSGRITGVGSSTLKALRDLSVGAPWYLSGATGEMSAGNGAAMRIAPIAFLDIRDLEEAYVVVRDVSSITHKHDEAYVGALVVYLLVSGILSGRELDELISSLPNALPDSIVRDKIVEIQNLSSLKIEAAAESIGVSGYVAESVPFAVFAATKVRDLGIQRVMEQVFCCGGDTDTNGSITGNIAGAIIGESEIPKGLLERIGQIGEVYEMLDSLETRYPIPY